MGHRDGSCFFFKGHDQSGQNKLPGRGASRGLATEPWAHISLISISLPAAGCEGSDMVWNVIVLKQNETPGTCPADATVTCRCPSVHACGQVPGVSQASQDHGRSSQCSQCCSVALLHRPLPRGSFVLFLDFNSGPFSLFPTTTLPLGGRLWSQGPRLGAPPGVKKPLRSEADAGSATPRLDRVSFIEPTFWRGCRS